MTFSATLTDTFCGEPNYSWVRKCTFEYDPSATNRALVRKAKKLLDVSKIRTQTHDLGDTLFSISVQSGVSIVVIIEPVPTTV